MTAVLRTEGLGHRYRGGVWGLRECTIVVPPGRVVALVGPNGSGKTTLLNMAASLLPPTTGSVQVAGLPPARRLDRIGYVAQDAPLWPRPSSCPPVRRALGRRPIPRRTSPSWSPSRQVELPTWWRGWSGKNSPSGSGRP